MGIIHSSKLKKSDKIGNKAAGLLNLTKYKLNVPNFFVIPFNSLTQIENITDIQELVNKWVTDNKINKQILWSIRSSANVEDGITKSYAGLFRTKINVRNNELAEAINYVLEGYSEIKKLTYNENKELEFGIIIQEMLNPNYSGVVFSQNPLNSTDKRTTINVIPGLGEALVSGQYDACAISIDEKRVQFANSETSYSGKMFNSELEEFTVPIETIKNDISIFLPEIQKNVSKLVNHKKQALDFEFCIANNQLYWLQMRPMTAIKQQIPDAVWDNSNIGENYPGLTLPLSTSFVKHTYTVGYKQMASFIGMSKKNIVKNKFLFDNIVGTLDGRMYYRLTSWQQLLYQLPLGKKTSKILPEIMGMDKADFKKPNQAASPLSYLLMSFNLVKTFIFFGYYKKQYEKANYEAIHNLTQEYFLGKTQQELITEITLLESKVIKKWIAPLINGLFAMLFYSSVKKLAKNSKINTEYPNFVNDILFSQGDVISVKIVRHFQEILDIIQQNKEIKQLFESENFDDVQKNVEKRHPELATKIQQYILQFGERCDSGELKMETLNYKDNPFSFYETIKKNLVSHSNKKRKEIKFDYKTVLNKNFTRFSLKRLLIQVSINQTIKRIRDRENYRFMRTQTFAILRFIFREMSVFLHNKELINNKNDIFYLTFDELQNLNLQTQYKTIIEARKLEYQGFKKIEKENRYLQFGNKFLAYEPDDTNNSVTDFNGTGCSSGIITGKVVFVDNPNIDPERIEGNILVAKYFEPGWINLFSKAGALVSERGSLLSHTAILSREIGLPSIVGAKKITKKLKNGDLIKINGATGKIKIIQKKLTELEN